MPFGYVYDPEELIQGMEYAGPTCTLISRQSNVMKPNESGAHIVFYDDHSPFIKCPTDTIPNEITGETLPVTLGHEQVYSLSCMPIQF